ncbi:UNKNOWN [Stylonychia lemnae]|uniref:Uncharacterized protein n=1 Tax=Stylonychia lemnae TaxID=5949 RepID=A0A077ZV04_STYLE|nr:UNKNOWN [Stylonychia lemnae]|eukprot:CDW73719.1 UNKNOWN [Stylonychia lemnae]
MYELLRAIKDKYRIYLMTLVDQDNKEIGAYKKAREILQKLIDEGIIQEQRSMYCTTKTGQIAQIRQLGSELHIESDIEVIENLHQHLSKFHLIYPQKSQYDTGLLKKIEEFVRTSTKVMFFTDIKSYTERIKAALSK